MSHQETNGGEMLSSIRCTHGPSLTPMETALAMSKESDLGFHISLN
jgi:GTP cyclohydrolase II